MPDSFLDKAIQLEIRDALFYLNSFYPQARLGVDVEGVFRRYDPEQSGSVLRSDFVQAVMQLGVGLLDSSTSR